MYPLARGMWENSPQFNVDP